MFGGIMPITKGTWVADGTRVTAPGGELVCEATAPNGKDNAKLIAAAPDLLAACKQALEYHGKNGRLEDGQYNSMAEAVAKAEGKR
jgi:hypothetical protein